MSGESKHLGPHAATIARERAIGAIDAGATPAGVKNGRVAPQRPLGRTSDAGALDLSILIVSYNTLPLLRQCLSSIQANAQDLSHEVIVVDNASRDGSPHMVAAEFPDVRLLRNTDNVGFSVANNAAIACARGRYVLLLNSDTLIVPGTLRSMVDHLDADPKIGIAGCRLLRPNGEMDLACRRSFPTPWVSLCRILRLNRLFPKSKRFGRYNLTFLDEEATYEVDSIVGAFMLVRQELLRDIGGLDEDYFMYGEDVDWCYRAKRAGWRVDYVGNCVTIHHKGASSRKESFRMNYHFHRAMFLFHSKHLRSEYPLLVNLAIYVGISARFSILAANHYLAKGAAALLHPLQAWRRRRAAKSDVLVESTIPERVS